MIEDCRDVSALQRQLARPCSMGVGDGLKHLAGNHGHRQPCQLARERLAAAYHRAAANQRQVSHA